MTTSSSTATASSGGISFAGLLAVIFICCKIFGVAPIAAWPWLWVLCPIWIPFAVVAFIFVVFGLILLGASLASNRVRR